MENVWLNYKIKKSENLELYLEHNLQRTLELAEIVIVNYVQLIDKEQELRAQIYE